MQLFVNDLTVIDFSYLCFQRGMVGESWIVDVVLDGGLDQQNMVLDFGHVKKIIKKTIDDVLDHRLLVPVYAKQVDIVSTASESKLAFESQQGIIALSCPNVAFAMINTHVIDSESVSDFLQSELKKVLPRNINKVELSLRCEQFDTPYYHYSHGLKKHDGNCQRIAHGHRSPIKIFENGKQSFELETQWAERWQDIYLASVEDCCAIELLHMIDDLLVNQTSHYGFSYSAPQGTFQLVMPKATCQIIPHDTTVELLAQYIATELKKRNQQNKYKVIAFEGVGKGAIAEME